MRRIFILIPSPHPTGPVKGAYALANALAAERRVTLVTLKPGPGAEAPLDDRVEEHSLAPIASGWRNRVLAYRALLEQSGGRARVASISMCLSADLVNRFSRAEAVTCASVRGNLVQNYRMHYGPVGVPLAVCHLVALRRIDRVVAITAAMARQVSRYAGQTPVVIGNFVDEPVLEPYRREGPRDGPLRFVFLGTLTHRKQPLLPIRAIAELRDKGVEAVLDVIGAGSLTRAAITEIRRFGLEASVTMHGHLPTPYPLIANADAMVLPSLSEGASRAALEALQLGVPCVLRAADGNAELVSSPACGALFEEDAALADTMRAVAGQSRARQGRRESLLPASFRQAYAAQRYLEVVDREP